MRCVQSPKFAVGGWAWVYNTAATIRQSANPDTDAKILKAKLSPNWTGPYKVLTVGSCSSAGTSDGSTLEVKLVYLDLPSDMPGADARWRVSVQRCKPCANPHDRGDWPKCLPAGLTQCVLNNFSKQYPPWHVYQDDVSTPLQRLEVVKITGHQLVQGRGGVNAVMHEAHWTGLFRPSWERERELQLSRHEIMR